MTSLSKIMFYMLAVGIILIAYKTYYVQANLEYIIFEEVFSWQFKVGFIGKVLMSFVAVLSFLLYKNYFPKYVTYCYVGLIVLVFIASFKDLGEVLKSPNELYSMKGLGTFTNIGIIFFAADTIHFKKILKLFYYICFFFLLAGIINLGKVGFGSSRTQYLYAVRDFTVYLMWVFPFFLLQEQENKKNNLLNFIVYLAIALFVISTASRSYLIIYVVYFIAKYKTQLQKKNSLLIMLGVGVIMAVGFFLLLNSGLGKTMEGALNNLTERTSEDSRTSQLAEFWEQYDFENLIQGVGPKATWFWSSLGPYLYLDNQFLLLSWWAGLPTLLVYVYFLVRSFFQKSEIQLYEKVKGIRLTIWWWILACMGFAIYVSISSELYYCFITLLMGLHVCRYSMIEPAADIEEG